MFAECLGVCKGINSIIGSGGKTTLIRTLADELKENAKVLITTTTHMFPYNDICCLLNPTLDDIYRFASDYQVLQIGNSSLDGKISNTNVSLSGLLTVFDYILIEADGSRGYPIKAHDINEPVIPADSSQIIEVIGADCFNLSIRERCHRPELFSEIAGVKIDDTITPEILGDVLNFENLSKTLFINKVENIDRLYFSEKLASFLKRKVCVGSLFRGDCICL